MCGNLVDSQVILCNKRGTRLLGCIYGASTGSVIRVVVKVKHCVIMGSGELERINIV